MRFSLLSSFVLAVLSWGGPGHVAQSAATISKTGNISLKGYLPPSCHVKINNGEEFVLQMKSPDNVSQPIFISSQCNRTSHHTLAITHEHTYDGKGALEHRELNHATPITYTVKTESGQEVTSENPLRSQGRQIEEKIQVHFDVDQTQNKTAGIYEGTATLTLKDA
jgi:spore coat protein U-like protein